MAAFEWTKERRVLRGPFDFFDKSMTLEVLEVDKTEDTTVLLRVTYNAGNDLLDLGRKHFHVPPLHLHFKQSETFKILRGELAVVTGYNQQETILTPENTPYEVPPWTPHTPYSTLKTKEGKGTVMLMRGHPRSDENPLDELFFEHIFRYLDECYVKQKMPDLVQMMVSQQATDSALVMFPSLAFLGPIRWWIPWVLQAGIASVGARLGYTPYAMLGRP